MNEKGKNKRSHSELDIRHLAENSFANCLRFTPLYQDDLKQWFTISNALNLTQVQAAIGNACSQSGPLRGCRFNVFNRSLTVWREIVNNVSHWTSPPPCPCGGAGGMKIGAVLLNWDGKRVTFSLPDWINMQLVLESILECVKLKGVIFKCSCTYATEFSHPKCHGQEIQKMQDYEQYAQKIKWMLLLNSLPSSAFFLNSDSSSACKRFCPLLQVPLITKHYVQSKAGPK